ncbi:sulfite reductase subunit alpha [Janthinobacterium agaricidamnosum]|uniref:NADPH--hemoprotein reductase n=1 Tax=Janthinobacterium agaricidamnosum NBRC 102515 = DSM 9628 TaxID=1349767 RepID=W0VA68_9BURK|nr:sulfite reductase subunit alpha [Janthinobacterium agaricidamnosum]CDG84253.1 flavodoxin family protein [Janthinobacterium agaricidamnosum NBRC 102515 = DSM 9628]
MIFTSDPSRQALLLVLLLSYLLVCLAPYLRVRRKRLAAQQAQAALANVPAWIVAYASQTGNAEELAGQTAATLRLAGIPVRLSDLSELIDADLQSAERILFLVSTYGEGDAPDNAAAFSGRLMARGLPLTQLHYAVLALGDSAYAQFCGFGRALDQWLAGQGASRLFERIEVNRSAPDAISQWRQQLSHLAGTSDAPDWSAPAFGDWRLLKRDLLNPGSAGRPLYHLELEPAAGALPAWQSGDLVQVAAPSEPGQPREYSIASIPQDGRVQLLVRQHRHADGSLGLVSGWLTAQAVVGDLIQLRLRQHKRFRLDGNEQRPLILIGNGSGIAGLRGHLKSRVLAGQRSNWLIFGERNAAFDYHYRAEIGQWQADGWLPRLDMVFSRDQPQRLYVQDRLLGNADELRQWLEQGAALYICGSLDGMAGGVDLALQQIIGRAGLDALAVAGRYRRDVY